MQIVRNANLAALAAAMAIAGTAEAQVGTNYVFQQSVGTYVPLTGGTVIGAVTAATGVGALDDVNFPVTLPFNFTYDGAPYNSIYVNSNGNLTFGATAPATTNYTPLSATTAYNGAVAAFGRDLMAGWMTAADRVTGTNVLTNVADMGPMAVGDFIGGNGIPAGTTITAIAGNTITLSANATTTGTVGYIYAAGPWAELRTETLGTAPNQVFVVQWSNFRRYTTTALTTAQHMKLNFQIRLHEATGKVEVVYGDCAPGLTTLTTVNQVGIRGATNAFPANVNNRLNTKGVNDDWQNSVIGTTNASGMLFNNVAPANVIPNGLTYEWALPVGAYANFTASVTGGASPLAVNFTDQSFTTNPGGIVSWAWDFDGDSTIDSVLQNPSFVYTSCGTYNVSLTVSDGVNPPSTLTKTNYVRTDAITANFTNTVIGPLVVQFTDTSNMPATSWSWDLDGDNVPDSTAQNPTWVYANANPVNVTLTVTRLCSAAATITQSIVPLQSISHNVAPANGLSSGATVFFDANITNPQGIEIGSMDVVGSTAATAFTVDVYIKQGSYLTFEKTPAAWTKVGTGSGTTVTTTAAAPVTLAAPIYLPAGSYGIALQYIGVGPRYAGTGSGPLQTVSNADLSLTLGASLATTVGNPFVSTGTPFTPRLWSGRLYYGTYGVTGSAGFGTFAQGCASSLGVSHLAGNEPNFGGTLNVTVNNLPMSLAIMMVGFSNTVSPFGPLPLDISPFGAPGCTAHVSPDVTQLLIGAANSAVWSFTVPNDPSLGGLPLYNQAFVLDTGFNALGAVLSDAGAMLIGN